MRSAIALIWVSLLWTLLCFLFYRDRTLILQASLPVWFASALAWAGCRAALQLFRRRRAAKPPARKPVPAKTSPPANKASPPAKGTRRTPRKTAARPRKRPS